MPRLNLAEDIKPLSEFRANVTTYIRQARQNRRPLVITHNGKAAAVLLGVAESERLMRKMEVPEDVRLAADQLARGTGVAHAAAQKQVLAKVRR